MADFGNQEKDYAKVVENAKSGSHSDPYQLGVSISKQTPFLLSEIRAKPLEQERLEREKEWKDEEKRFDREYRERVKGKEAEFKRKLHKTTRERLEDGRMHKVLTEQEREFCVRQVERSTSYLSKEEAKRRANKVKARNEELLEEKDKCPRALGRMDKAMKGYNDSIEDIRRTNRVYYSQKESENLPFVENPDYHGIVPDENDDEVTRQKKKIENEKSKYLSEDQMLRELDQMIIANQKNKPPPKSQADIRIEQYALHHPLKTEKTVYVQASCFSDYFGLLAVSLIDWEIKIYFLSMRGGKVELKEHCSFKTKNLVT